MKLKATTAVLVGLLTLGAVTPAYADTIDGGTLAPGDTVTATVANAGDEVDYTLAAVGNHTARITVSENSWTDCGQLLLQGADADELTAVGDLRGDPLTSDVLFTATGDAKLIVRGCGAATGQATLSWQDTQLQATTAPSIQGTGQVGGTLLANDPLWSEPAVQNAYQWLADGLAVGDGSGSLALTEAMRGQVITLVVTGRKTGFAAVDSPSSNSVTVNWAAQVSGSGELTGYRKARLSLGLNDGNGQPVDGPLTLIDADGSGTRPVQTVGGAVEVTLGSLAARRHHFTVAYPGSPTLDPASASFTLAVPAKLTPELAIDATSPTPGVAKLSIGVMALGEHGLGGKVTIRDGKKTVKKDLKVTNGRASWTGKKLKAGKHTFTVSYGGTSHVTSGSVKVALSVMPKHRPSVRLTGSSPAPGKITFVVHVTSPGATPTGKVTIKRGSHKVVTLKLKHGSASWTGKGANGTHSYKASYAGDSQTATGSDAASIYVHPYKRYPNCTALRRDYPHGVGKAGAHDKVRGSTEPVTNFYRSTALYNLQLDRSDLDNDGVACEQH